MITAKVIISIVQGYTLTVDEGLHVHGNTFLNSIMLESQ